MNNKGVIDIVIDHMVDPRFEWVNCRSSKYHFLTDKCRLTDDTVMTMAISDS